MVLYSESGTEVLYEYIHKNRVLRGDDMTKVEQKTEEIVNKWKAKMQEQNIDDKYKFYRMNQFELQKDLEELWLICKLEELESN